MWVRLKIEFNNQTTTYNEWSRNIITTFDAQGTAFVAKVNNICASQTTYAVEKRN